MGSAESKQAACAPTKAPPNIPKHLCSELADPRSPSAHIDRTPIQVAALISKTSGQTRFEVAQPFTDPRSPTAGISRTPVQEAVRATVSSFARRLGLLFHNEVEVKDPASNLKRPDADIEEDAFKDEELASSEPLITPQPGQKSGAFSPLVTPVQPPLCRVNESSPFVLLEVPQVGLEIETETSISLELAEEARETPLHKRLSMSLITCHEGATSTQIFAEVHHNIPPSPASGDVEHLKDGAEHSYALLLTDSEPESPAVPTESPIAPATDAAVAEKAEDEEKTPCPEAKDKPVIVSEPKTASSQEQPPPPCTGIRCPNFSTKSPSQVVFKPQWLGQGFGATGLRARGVQGRMGKGSSSPLAVQVAVKNAVNENRAQSAKLKQKGLAQPDVRSPLQLLKETNSPREQRAQKVKVATPDRQRLGQMDRRVLAVSLDKENR